MNPLTKRMFLASGKAHSGRSSRFKLRGGTRKLNCFTCHSEGDLKRDCPVKKLSGFVRKGKHDQNSDSSNDEIEYMTPMRDFLYDFKVIDGGSVQLGDNRTCTIKGTGKMGRIKVIKGCRVMMTRIGKKNCVYFRSKSGIHRVEVNKRVWFEVELLGAQKNRQAEVFHVSNDNVAVAQRRFEGKQLEEKINMGCLGFAVVLAVLITGASQSRQHDTLVRLPMDIRLKIDLGKSGESEMGDCVGNEKVWTDSARNNVRDEEGVLNEKSMEENIKSVDKHANEVTTGCG
ncbi:hypothetical protein Tco_0825666 [Tanacetum coccineum]